MIRALWSAGTGMNVQQTNLDIIANNIANVSTNGFKKSRADFQDLMYQTVRLQGARTEGGGMIPTGIQIGLGSMLSSVQKIFQQGDYQRTDNELDIAIEGNGFFQVTLPSGEKAYTRAGGLKTDGTGKLVTPDGYAVEPSLIIPAKTTSISIENDGALTVQIQGQTAPQQVGTIELANFINPTGLRAIGKNMFMETEASGAPTTGKPGQNGMGTIIQGFLEMSNVNVMQEMINMIIGQRAYEVNTKVVQAADEMLQMTNNLRR
jgi:flagellar basal-body rod protein FlgG